MRTTKSCALPALLALAALTGCASYRGVTSEDVVPRTELRARFAAPRALTFRAAGNDVAALDDVEELEGRMIAWDADSIRLGASSARRAAGATRRFEPGTTTTFALTDVRLEEIQRHNGRTIALMAAIVAGVALMIAIGTYREPPPPPPPEPKPPK